MVSTREGDYLFVDAVENRILTQIPEKKPATSILINQSSTGVCVLSQDKSVSFYQFNNCVTPVFMTVFFRGLDLILQNETTTGKSVKSKFKKYFNK